MLWDWEVAGSISCLVIPKTIKKKCYYLPPCLALWVSFTTQMEDQVCILWYATMILLLVT